MNLHMEVDTSNNFFQEKYLSKTDVDHLPQLLFIDVVR